MLILLALRVGELTLDDSGSGLPSRAPRRLRRSPERREDSLERSLELFDIGPHEQELSLDLLHRFRQFLLLLRRQLNSLLFRPRRQIVPLP